MEIVNLAIVATVLSLFVQLVKANSNFNALGIRFMVVVLSLLAGTFYYFLGDTEFWTISLEVLALANTAYLFLIKPFEE